MTITEGRGDLRCPRVEWLIRSRCSGDKEIECGDCIHARGRVEGEEGEVVKVAVGVNWFAVSISI